MFQTSLGRDREATDWKTPSLDHFSGETGSLGAGEGVKTDHKYLTHFVPEECLKQDEGREHTLDKSAAHPTYTHTFTLTPRGSSESPVALIMHSFGL